jgi:hypothetical protein
VGGNAASQERENKPFHQAWGSKRENAIVSSSAASQEKENKHIHPAWGSKPQSSDVWITQESPKPANITGGKGDEGGVWFKKKQWASESGGRRKALLKRTNIQDSLDVESESLKDGSGFPNQHCCFSPTNKAADGVVVDSNKNTVKNCPPSTVNSHAKFNSDNVIRDFNTADGSGLHSSAQDSAHEIVFNEAPRGTRVGVQASSEESEPLSERRQENLAKALSPGDCGDRADAFADHKINHMAASSPGATRYVFSMKFLYL